MDWLRRVDWTRSNAELAEKYEVTCYEVRNHRKRFFNMLRIWGSHRRYGVSPSHLAEMRKKYGVVPDPRRKKRKKPKKLRTPGPPGKRSSSPGLRTFVLQAIDAGIERAMEIHDYVLNTWGYVAERTTYGALSHLLFLNEIMYTRMYNGVRLYTRKGSK